MPRETSEYVLGEYWLDKRRDGASDYWQITTYKPGSRQVVYRSTRLRDLEAAKGAFDAFFTEQRAKRPQPANEAELVAAMRLYWEEHGKKAEAAYAIAGSFRAFIGFLMQDEAGVFVTVAQVDRALTQRFQDWRMAPHSWAVDWGGKEHRHNSNGVKGETVATDLARVRAAINHALAYGRIPTAPKVHGPDARLRSEARDTLLSIEQMGAIMMVAAQGSIAKDGSFDPDGIAMFRWLAHQVATCSRPVAALAFDPASKQCDFKQGLVDLHPAGKARTRKRNPIVPMIDEMRPIYAQWAKDGARVARSRKRAWRTIRRVLDLPLEVEPKTLRYSVATELRRMGTVPAIQLESLLGHEAVKGVTARYAKYDPLFMAEAKAALSNIFQRVAIAAVEWGAVHLLSKTGNSASKVLDRNSEEAQNSARNSGAAYRTRTCDPRITNAGKGNQTAVSCEERTEQERSA